MADVKLADMTALGSMTGIELFYVDSSGNGTSGSDRRVLPSVIATYLFGLAAFTEAAQDVVGAFIANNGGMVITYDDAGNVENISIAQATASDIWTGTATNRVVTPAALFAAAASQALTDAATITPDFGAGINFHVTLGGNRTLANPTNAKIGQSGVIRVLQDGTGSRTLAYGSKWKFPGGAPTLTTTASAIDEIGYYVWDANNILCTINKALS